MIAKAVASDINASFFSINGPELVNKYVGKSESGLRDVLIGLRRATFHNIYRRN